MEDKQAKGTAAGTAESENENKAYEIMGITKERTMELKDVMLKIADDMKTDGKTLNMPNIIDYTSKYITDVREAVFMGNIFGQALMSVDNPLMGMLALMGRKAR